MPVGSNLTFLRVTGLGGQKYRPRDSTVPGATGHSATLRSDSESYVSVTRAESDGPSMSYPYR